MEVGIYNHHPSSWLTVGDIDTYTRLLNQLLPLVLASPPGPKPTLSGLDEIEVSLVDDPTIADVHLNYMNIPGATDVITFPHGEIIISLDTAASQSREFGESKEKELFRYIVHGMLHLHGYLDYTTEDRDTMFAVQEPLVNQLWENREKKN